MPCAWLPSNFNKNHLLEFPPPPPSAQLEETIIRGWCEDMSPTNFMEAGCDVCGQLTPVKQLIPITESRANFDILKNEGMGYTRMERKTALNPIVEIKGPIMDEKCSRICHTCDNNMMAGEVPKYALARD